jgi:hypothetical protein
MKEQPRGVVPAQPRCWMAVRAAAAILDMRPEALRRTLERRAVRAPDGGTEASLDGVRARKFGRTWRVLFSDRWLPPHEPILQRTGS